jgi:hypothetical protein
LGTSFAQPATSKDTPTITATLIPARLARSTRRSGQARPADELFATVG